MGKVTKNGQMNLGELRTILSETMRQLVAGTTTASTANAIANTGGKILQSIKVEIEYYKAIGVKPNIAALSLPEAGHSDPA